MKPFRSMCVALAFPLVLARASVCFGSPQDGSFDFTCAGAAQPPQLISGEVAGPRTLDPGDVAPPSWNPDFGRLSRGGIHYISANYVHIKLVTDSCTGVLTVRVGARLVPRTNTGGLKYSVQTTPLPGSPARQSHSVLVYFPNAGDGSTDTVKVVVGRQLTRTSEPLEFSIPVVHVRTVEATNVNALIGFSETELFNTFSKALYDQFNREQNSTVITKADGEQVRIYGYDPTQTGLSVNALGASFSFTFKIDKTCQPQAHVQGRFTLNADFSGVSLDWVVPPYTNLQWPPWCEIVTGIPGIGEIVDWLFFSGAEGEVSAAVRGRIEEAVKAALPAGNSFNLHLHGTVTQADQLLVNLVLPAPSVTINVPYDAFDMDRSGTAVPLGGSVLLVASDLAPADHVAGGSPQFVLRSGPNGVPRAGTADFPNAHALERSGALVWHGKPVASLLTLRSSPQGTTLYRYTPGCSIEVDPSSAGPVSLRLGLNDTAADAQRLRPPVAWSHAYWARLFFFDDTASGQCAPKPPVITAAVEGQDR